MCQDYSDIISRIHGQLLREHKPVRVTWENTCGDRHYLTITRGEGGFIITQSCDWEPGSKEQLAPNMETLKGTVRAIVSSNRRFRLPVVALA